MKTFRLPIFAYKRFLNWDAELRAQLVVQWHSGFSFSSYWDAVGGVPIS